MVIPLDVQPLSGVSMDVQLTIFKMPKIYINPANQRVIKMKALVRKYKQVRCRDIEEFALDVRPFKDIRHQFQIGHMHTLRYISFHRDYVVPTREWLEGFIKAAEAMEKHYKNYQFQE